MQLLNICTKKTYDKNGKSKTKWYRVGVLKIADSGKQFIRFFHQPDTEFFVSGEEENRQRSSAAK